MKMQKLKSLFASFGITGLLLGSVCCVLPLIGLSLSIGIFSSFLPYMEMAGIIMVLLALVFLAIYLIRKRKQSKEECTEACGCSPKDIEASIQDSRGDRPIACDMNVFEKEERKEHVGKSSEILYEAQSVHELEDGFAFQHPYSPEKFESMTQWVKQENKCCPFLVFELAIQPDEKDHKIWLKLRGSKKIKKFLESSRAEYGW